MRKINRVLVAIVVMSSLLLISCQGATEDQREPAQGIPSPMSIATLQSASTPMSVFDYPGQVTDGLLLFSIELANAKCVQSDQTITLRLNFSNLTDGAITIPSDFSIAVNRKGSGGNLIPRITTEEGKDILALADYQIADIFSTPSSLYSEIPAHQSIQFSIDFVFPQELVISVSSDTYEVGTPSPGRYFIRLVYSGYQTKENIWHGAVGSELIEICLSN